MNEVVHTSPTIGSNVEEIVVKNTHFLMWDIGGQESLRSSWNTYYSNTEVGSTFSDFSFFALSSPGGRGGGKGIVRQLACLFAAQTSAGAAQVKGSLWNKGACLKGEKAAQMQHMRHHRQDKPLV